MRISDSSLPHLTDHGGRVLKHVDVAPVYLGAYWASAQGRADRAYNDRAMAALVTDPGMTGIWKQYGAGSGSSSPSLALTTSNPRRLTNENLQSLIRQQIDAGTFDTKNPERVFTFVLPPGCELVGPGGESSHHGVGGYHGSVNVGGREVYYAAVAYSEAGFFGAKNGVAFTDQPRDNVTICESHEITEAVTDPDVMRAMRERDRSLLGWYDDQTLWSAGGVTRRGLGEIGDIPVTVAGLSGDSDLSSVWGRSHGFAFQKEWSDQDGQAELQPKKHH